MCSGYCASLCAVDVDLFSRPPVHPSVSSWTLAQAFAGERGRLCFPEPVMPDDDGLELLSYTPARFERCIDEDGEEVSLPCDTQSASLT